MVFVICLAGCFVLKQRGGITKKRSRRGKPVTDFLLFSCPLCGREDKLLQDKKGRPYFRCESCRARLFAPVDPGRSRLIAASKKMVRRQR